MKRLLVAVSASCAISSWAVPAVRLEVPVTYHPNAGVVESVRSECQIESMLANRVGGALQKLNRRGGSTVEAGADPSGDNVLRVQITHVLGVGGGAWSGPKAITLTAELLENGKVVRQTKISRWNIGGAFGAFRGTCSILDRAAETISRDLSRWVSDPFYKIAEQPVPKETMANNAAQSAEAVESPVEPKPESN
ncbi:MAG: hypothetical protein H6R10_941 [Rhodocyclaceae bacterium]|nr:hypothetical protein [Rhodocyclaceae bacterium]